MNDKERIDKMQDLMIWVLGAVDPDKWDTVPYKLKKEYLDLATN